MARQIATIQNKTANTLVDCGEGISQFNIRNSRGKLIPEIMKRYLLQLKNILVLKRGLLLRRSGLLDPVVLRPHLLYR